MIKGRLLEFPNSRLMEGARQIGARLCDEVFWDDPRQTCTWRGMDVIDHSDNVPAATLQTLGGNLYGGSAGIAFFLSHLARVSAGKREHAVALGGLKHAVGWATAHAETLPALSLFSGPLGVAYAVHRGAFCAGKELSAASDKFVELALRAFAQAPQRQALDIVSGFSGAIPFLLEMHRTTGQPAYLAFAHALGKDICARADWTEHYCCWDTNETAKFDAPPLTGLSHGAGGIAYALLRLHDACADGEFLATARGAYAYEDSLFDAAQGNWLDLREGAPEDGRGEPAPVYWCHGAAGILLSRAAAARLDRPHARQHLAAVRIAAATTQKALAKAMAAHRSDATICHGICGLVEALHAASLALDDPGLKTLAVESCLGLIEKYENSQDWPSGVFGGGANPSLMVGDAGIGYTFLRLLFPDEMPAVTLVS